MVKWIKAIKKSYKHLFVLFLAVPLKNVIQKHIGCYLVVEAFFILLIVSAI